MSKTISKSNLQPNHHRVLDNPAPYSSLIPAPAGIKINEGAGDTFLSLDIMYKIATKYAHQAKRLAESKFSGLSSLSDKVSAIRNFLYRNFQYQADTDSQQIRSFSQSWAERTSGIDCKSYAVAASSILQNLGIKHYFRKIKQPRNSKEQPQNFADHYSHVYVVVPKDQKTGSLSLGHYVIDPVPSYTTEPFYLTKHDYPVMMKHVSMAGPSCQSLPGEYQGYQLKNIKPDANGTKAIIEIFHKGNPSQVQTLETPFKDCAKAVETLSGLGCDCSQLGQASPGPSNKTYIIVGLSTVAAIIIAGIYLSKNKKSKANG